MILAIDIDDVITDTSASIIAHAQKHETEICEEGDILNHLPEVMRGEFPTPATKKYLNHFMADIMAGAFLKSGAKEGLRKLKEQGHTLCFITARGEIKFPGSTKVTKDMIAREELPCDKIVFESVDKLNDCLDNKIDILVDDSVKNCEDVAAGGIKTILFTTVVNESIPTDVQRVSNWDELCSAVEQVQL